MNMNNPTISPASAAKIVEVEWGQLTWYAGAQIKNSEELTVGKCIIKPGYSNPKHLHPNCEEVLVLPQGKVSHTIGAGKEVVLNVGDTITMTVLAISLSALVYWKILSHFNT